MCDLSRIPNYGGTTLYFPKYRRILQSTKKDPYLGGVPMLGLSSPADALFPDIRVEGITQGPPCKSVPPRPIPEGGFRV